MAVCSAILFLVLTSHSAIGYILESDYPTESIIWPTEYHFKAEKISLITGIVEPFEIWYSAEYNRSRIDYYGGTVKKYYYGETDTTFGALYMIHPETTEEETNVLKCSESWHMSEQYDFLPPVDDFEYAGQEYIDGKEVQVWKWSEVFSGKARVEETLYVYRTVQDVDIPVRYIEKLFSLWTGALESHSITQYYDYKPTTDLNDLEVEDEDSCESEGKLGKNLAKDLKFLHPDVGIDIETAFQSYKRHHGKKYKHEDEHQMRRYVFRDNWSRVVNHNRKNLSYKMEVNEFSDRTDEELKYLTGTRPSNPEELGTHPFPHTLEEVEELSQELPESYDMRLDGVITRVKSQASCGSCWAFSTTAAVEGAVARSNGGRDLDLSEQSLVDCAWGFDNAGCDGGQLDGALKYVLKHGIPTEREYGPYLQQDGYCHISNVSETYNIRGFAKVPSRSESALKLALYKYGPVSVAIHASSNMKPYSSGVFYDIDCEEGSVNHGVTVVGYGVQDDQTYWIVKNSWGESWGEDGYILMSAKDNNCNLMDMAYYPIV